jgi:hypothetical protein
MFLNCMKRTKLTIQLCTVCMYIFICYLHYVQCMYVQHTYCTIMYINIVCIIQSVCTVITGSNHRVISITYIHVHTVCTVPVCTYIQYVHSMTRTYMHITS